jgi:crossover junction endodeoxyribonuclease RusA
LSVDWEGVVHLFIEFMPPDRRARDDDNLIASFKSGRDGMADALGINDKLFRIHPFVSDKTMKNGAVSIRLAPCMGVL